MGVLEVVLLLVGAVLAVLSFVLPAIKEEVPRETKVLAKEEIKSMVDKEMNDIRQHVDDVVDEAVGYAVEKTERSLERLTNEKIMAVNEYSDTVLQEIHKNHEEAMFLYDMLNAKHDNLKNTMSEATKTVQEVQETKREAEAVVQSFQQLETPTIEVVSVKEPEFESLKVMVSEQEQEEEPIKVIKEWDFLADASGVGVNNNEQILALHKKGKSTVAIAKELGLGVGEVKLVIDLHKNL